jgi:hypothetical protein
MTIEMNFAPKDETIPTRDFLLLSSERSLRVQSFVELITLIKPLGMAYSLK